MAPFNNKAHFTDLGSIKIMPGFFQDHLKSDSTGSLSFARIYFRMADQVLK